MTNIVTHQTGLNVEPHASNHGLAAAELAIKQKATAHTTAASGKLYYGENVDGDGTVALRTFGIGILAGDDSDQSQTGVPIGGNMYFKEGSGMTIAQSTSGDVVTLTFTPSTSATLTGAGSTIDSEDLTASRALVSNGSGKVAVSAVTATELGYLDGVTSAVQTQLNAKQASLTFGKSSGNALKSEEALTSNDILLMGSSHVKGRTYAELKADLSLEIGTDVQAYDAQLDTLAAMTSGEINAFAALSATEIGIIDGLTATTAEINYLDNDDLTAADLTKLAALTASAAEINILDGVTGVTAAELSYIGDVTSAIQSQLDGKAATGRKLDDFGTPDDNTDLDATTSRHGLLPKLGGGTSNFLRADGSWATPSASVSANSIGADELNVSGDGSSGQVLTSDADGSFSWTAKTSNTDTNYYVDGLSLSGGTITASVNGATNQTVDITGLYTAGDGLTLNTRDIDLDASLTTVTSILNSGLVIGRDSQNDIDFGTDNTILFRADNTDQVKLINNVFSPVSDSDVDLGTTSIRWKDAFVDSITVTGEVDAASLDVEGNADINGTLEADAITVNGTALNTVIAGVTVADATTAANIAITDESSDSTCFPVFATTATGDRTLHSGSNFTFNANTGEVGATTFNPTSGFTIGTGDGGGHTINNVDIAGEFTDSDEHLMTAAAINDRINSFSGVNKVGDITNVGVTSPITGGGSSGSVTIAIQDASTSAKGAAQFSSSYFSASSGTISIKDDGIDSDQIAAGAVDLAHLSASGTKSSSTYLRGDNTWAAVSSGSSLTVGSDNQIPVVNSGGDDLEYTSNFTYDGTKLTIIGDTNNALLELRSTDDDANEGPVMNFFRTSGSGADNDIGGAIQWNFTDESAWGPTKMGSISMKVEDETVSTKDSHFMIEAYKGNTLYNLQVGATGPTAAFAIKLDTANVCQLGSSSYDFSKSYVRENYGYDGSGYSAGAISSNASGPSAFTTSAGTDVGTGASATLTFASGGGIVTLADIQPAPSDSRYKENVTDLDKGLTFLESLPSPKTFDFKDAVKEIGVKEPKKGELGFLAQDIEKILPDVVVTAKDENSEFGEFKTISYSDLDKTIIYSLINAVKELSAKVKALEDA